MSNLFSDRSLEAVLDRLHSQSEGQGGAWVDYFGKRAAEGSIDWNAFDADADRFLEDKLVALDRDKARFCYELCRALGATRIVEAGSSFGVSTLYLAAAVRDNTLASGGKGVVIGTESEPAKVAAARANFAAAGLTESDAARSSWASTFTRPPAASSCATCLLTTMAAGCRIPPSSIGLSPKSSRRPRKRSPAKAGSGSRSRPTSSTATRTGCGALSASRSR